MTRLHNDRLVLIQDFDQLLQGLLVLTKGALSCSNTSIKKQGSRSARLSPQSMTWDECKVYKCVSIQMIQNQQPPKVRPLHVNLPLF